jgi:tRNA (cytidine/uridine-2'-O-)-methyltransferase
MTCQPDPARMFALTTRGVRAPASVGFQADDCFVFGSESAGLPQAVRDTFSTEQLLRLPMRPGNRSLNLSNAVAVVVFEAWRQLGFEGSADPPQLSPQIPAQIPPQIPR